MKKLKRRDFLSITAAVMGVGALQACTCVKKTEENSEADRTVEFTSEDKISLNREMPRELVMNLLDQKVNKYMKISYNCAQSSFLALKEQFGLEDGTILKALTPLPGIAERGETCGAVIGPLMALGLIYGRGQDRLDDWEAYRESLIPTGKFCRLFEKEYGSTMCSDIQKVKFGRSYHLTDPQDLALFQADGATEKCSAVVRKAVRIAAEIILDGTVSQNSSGEHYSNIPG
ncbi:MAG: C-GCAxxG-C-C family protein [Bacteroidales bacterium]|nr:C-GCAxxG-C-C family protein [Bacteroidales bacterium]